jgi:hypothetical protein
MKVYFRGMRKHSKHQMHISTWQTPNWFEKWFMFRRAKTVEYVGKGTKWFRMTLSYGAIFQYKPVTDATLLKFLKDLHP